MKREEMKAGPSHRYPPSQFNAGEERCPHSGRREGAAEEEEDEDLPDDSSLMKIQEVKGQSGGHVNNMVVF